MARHRLCKRRVTGRVLHVSPHADDESPSGPQHAAHLGQCSGSVGEELKRLLAERHEYVQRLLTDAREALDHLAQTLLREEAVSREALVRILGPRPEVPREGAA